MTVRSQAELEAPALTEIAAQSGRLRLDAEIVNLMDRENACCVDEFFFEAGANGTLDVERELDSWLGITPSLSVSWEF